MTEDRKRLHRRLLAFAGLWLLLGGLLTALSFVVVVFIATAVLLGVVLAGGAVWLLRRYRVEERLWAGVVLAARAVRRLGTRFREVGVRRHLKRLRIGSRLKTVVVSSAAAFGRLGRRLHDLDLPRRNREVATRLPDRVNALVARGVRSYAITVYWLLMRASPVLSRLQPRSSGARSQALRLNELGAELRRRGDHEQAAERHRVALEIARDLGDEEAEALTLNNLALALAKSGAEEEAVQHLEEALDVLRVLGDDEHEARVIANLGMVHRRQGHREEAITLLHEALDKLPPESPAYRQVEAELRTS